jgi:membrane associated rhomboid family serine protease
VYYLGASGSVFGLFAVSVMDRLSLEPRSFVEVLVLGQFVLNRIAYEIQNLAGGTNLVNINRTAHLGGALAGVVLCLLYMRWRMMPVPKQNEYKFV